MVTDLLRVSLQACHHIAEKSSRQDVKVASPESQSLCPAAEVVKRPPSTSAEKRDTRIPGPVFILFVARFPVSSNGYGTEGDLAPPASTSNAGNMAVNRHLQSSQAFCISFCLSTLFMLSRTFAVMAKTEAGGGDGGLRSDTRSGSGVAQMFAGRCQDSSQS